MDPNFSSDFQNGNVSFWVASTERHSKRPSLDRSIDIDVAIVGGGLTGLWSAYYLKSANPSLEIAIFEKEFIGFGASGRNGGWLSAMPMGLMRHYRQMGGDQAAVELQKEMFHTVEESVRVAQKESFGEEVQQDGLIHVATNNAQFSRLKTELSAMQQQGWSESDVIQLTKSDLADRMHIKNAKGAFWTPHCARVHPAKFTFGLANAVERLGVKIYEGTTVEEIRPHEVITEGANVKASYIVQALEGYTCSLKQNRRSLLPMNSSLVITEPLSEEASRSIAWRGAELLGDMAHSFTYVQRTADNRIALGGRGVPYNYGSRFNESGKTSDKAVTQLSERLLQLFPSLADTRLAHTWSGVLGVPRDWTAGVSINNKTGLISAGGYVGHGVAATNLAGRTIRDLVLGEKSSLTRLPWVGHKARNWELEPVRWIGARSLYALYRFADRQEYRGARPKTSPAAKLGNLISGRY